MLRPSDVPNTLGANDDYPYGRLKDDSVAGDKTGTPVRSDWLQNIYYSILAVLAKAGIEPDGTPETALASQFADAVRDASNLSAGNLSMDRIAEEAITNAKIADLDAAKLTGELAEARLPDTAARRTILTDQPCPDSRWYRIAVGDWESGGLIRLTVNSDSTNTGASVIFTVSLAPGEGSNATILSASRGQGVGIPQFIGILNISDTIRHIFVWILTDIPDRTLSVEIIGSPEKALVSDFAIGSTTLGDVPSTFLVRYNEGIDAARLGGELAANVPLKNSPNVFTLKQTISNGNGLEIINGIGTTKYTGSGAGGALAHVTSSGESIIDINPENTGTDIATVRMFRGTNTSGARLFSVMRGNNTAANTHLLNGGEGSVVFNNSGLSIGSTGFRFRGLGIVDGSALLIDSNGFIGPQTSSERYKTDIEDMDMALAEKVVNLTRPVYYRNKEAGPTYPHEWSYWGIIAEELALIDKRLVHWGYWPEDYEDVTVMVDEQVTKVIEGEDGEKIEVTETVQSPSTTREVKADAVMTPTGVQYDRIAVLMLKVMQADRLRLDSLETRLAKLEGTNK